MFTLYTVMHYVLKQKKIVIYMKEETTSILLIFSYNDK